MLVEHSFITTSAPDAALSTAGALLLAMGFTPEPCGEPDCIAVRRGRTQPQRAKKVSDLPQHVRVAYDRGRVNVAASITEYRKADRLHRELLLALAQALEARVGHAATPEVALGDWYLVHANIEERARERRRTRRIVAGILLTIVVVVIGWIVWAVRH